MACRLFGAKPLTEPMLVYCPVDSLETVFSEIGIGILSFSFKKMHPKLSVELATILSRGRWVKLWRTTENWSESGECPHRTPTNRGECPLPMQVGVPTLKMCYEALKNEKGWNQRLSLYLLWLLSIYSRKQTCIMKFGLYDYIWPWRSRSVNQKQQES